MDFMKLIEETEKATQNIEIPNQPQVLLDLNEEMTKPEPDFKTITDLISKDIALTAQVIKIAKTPFWGTRREINSVHIALVVLGLRNFKNIILSSCLRNVFKNDVIPDEEFKIFYNHSLKSAGVSRFLADNITFKDNERVDQNQAYLVGLFHDCGIMIMAKRYQNYYDRMSL